MQNEYVNSFGTSLGELTSHNETKEHSQRQQFISFVYSALNSKPIIQPLHIYLSNIKDSYNKLDKIFYNPIADHFLENICTVMTEYICGNHNSAFDLLCDGIDKLNLKTLVKPMSVECVYRGREKHQKNGVYLPFESSREMLHIPFEERWRVSNQRYSYIGMPSFYVGESVKVIEEELKRESNHQPNSLAIARFKVKPDPHFYILDLAHFFELSVENMEHEAWNQLLTIWPLILMCSVRFKYPTGQDKKISFKQEYIIPQLLLEIVIDKRICNVSGIRYRSVHFMEPIWKCSDDIKTWNNYVFPAKENKDSGHSDFILQRFEFDTFIRN